jgi:site-specific DNA-methyltransferase (adenine-specific)/site-specific DNA-methyltransferase (cytosine-N4-specific)
MDIDSIYHGDCIQLAANLDDNSISAVVCSPPYAMQRKKAYGGISEKEYPRWTVRWMNSLRQKLKPDGSVFIVIRPHLTNGQVSDYVLRTQLAVRKSGWKESETLIWFKPDAPPLGSVLRPRRSWEYILWFSQAVQPYVNLYACGNQDSTRVGGFAGSDRFGEGKDGVGPLHSSQVRTLKKGTSRCSDVIQANIGSIDRGVLHPAMYPQGLSDFMIKTFSREGDLILDPFCGSGQTCLSAKRLQRRYLGFDLKAEYVEIARERLS